MNRIFSLLLITCISMLVVPVSAKTIKPNTTVDKLLGEIGQCTSITLAKCPELKKAVDKGPKHVPYLANKLANGETPILRLASAHVLQFFPQEEGLRALAYQLSRERDRKVLSAIKQSLTVRGEAPVLRIARELLKSEEPGERVMASNLIGTLVLNGGGLELVAASKDPVPRVQYAAIAAMSSLKGNDDCKRTLYELLAADNISWTLRHKVITAAKDLQLFEAAPLIALSLSSPEMEVKKAAATALGEFKVIWAAPALVGFLSEPELSGAASLALAALGDTSSVESMVKAVEQPGIPFRGKTEVLWALGTLKATQATPTLIAMLKDPNGDLVYHVANSLGRIGAKDATLPLIMTMKHEKEQVRDISLWALEQITGEKHGFDNEKWLAWYKANHPE